MQHTMSACQNWLQCALRLTSDGLCVAVQVESSMPRDIARGIASVKRFVRQQSIKGVHGTLIELIECSNRLHTAIEVLNSPSTQISRACPAEFLTSVHGIAVAGRRRNVL